MTTILANPILANPILANPILANTTMASPLSLLELEDDARGRPEAR
jgi:hypothetical protein